MTDLPWTYLPFVGFDVETTGVDVETALIVTATVVRMGGGLETEVLNRMSDLNGAEIPAEATKIHNITTEMARAAGRPAALVIRDIVDRMALYAARGWPIVAMNAPFDLTILERECERYGVRSLWNATPLVLDPRVLDKQMDPYRPGGRRLIDLCHHYRVSLEGAAHTSEVDAKAACGVVRKIAKRNRTLERMDLGDLHEAQAVWAREHNDSFRRYQLRKFGTLDETPFDWPLIPRPEPVGAP
jgi:DNA polymerase-3 subunit epsilon